MSSVTAVLHRCMIGNIVSLRGRRWTILAEDLLHRPGGLTKVAGRALMTWTKGGVCYVMVRGAMEGAQLAAWQEGAGPGQKCLLWRPGMTKCTRRGKEEISGRWKTSTLDVCLSREEVLRMDFGLMSTSCGVKIARNLIGESRWMVGAGLKGIIGRTLKAGARAHVLKTIGIGCPKTRMSAIVAMGGAGAMIWKLLPLTSGGGMGMYIETTTSLLSHVGTITFLLGTLM